MMHLLKSIMQKLNMLMMELQDVSEWELLGVYLGVSPTILHNVKRENPRVELMKYNMLAEWLKSTPEASWKDLVSALTFMKEICVAKIIKEKYNVED